MQETSIALTTFGVQSRRTDSSGGRPSRQRPPGRTSTSTWSSTLISLAQVGRRPFFRHWFAPLSVSLRFLPCSSSVNLIHPTPYILIGQCSVLGEING